MLHSLSLTLLKTAMPTPEEEARITEKLRAREQSLMQQRGVTPKTVQRPIVTPGTNEFDPMQKRTFLDPAGTRMSGPASKDILKETSPVTARQQLRYNTTGRLGRWWGGSGLLGNKWGNRATLLGGLGALGALGLHLKGQSDAKNVSIPEGYPSYEDFKISSYVQDAISVPVPIKPPKMPSLGPGIKSLATKTPGASAPSFSGSSGTGSSFSGAGASTKAAGDLTGTILATGAGGLGGWLLGEKVLKPLIDMREQQIIKSLSELQGLKKIAPIGTALAGAGILAALHYLKDKREDASRPIPPRRPAEIPKMYSYDQLHSGFRPDEQQSSFSY
jgi:hypothetical protein